MMQRMKGTLRPGRKAGVLALAVLLLTCVLMAGAVSAADLTTGELSDWQKDRTELVDWVIEGGTISLTVGEDPTGEYVGWHGNKASVENVHCTNYW